MANLNRVFLAGNLTRDPEVRYTPSGKAVGDLRMAVNRQYRMADGETRDETCFVNVGVWGRQAETSGEYLKKGSPVLIEGRLHYDEWEKDGQKHNRLRVVAERVQFLSAPRGASYRDDEGAPTGEAGNSEAGPPPPEMTDGMDVGDSDNLPF